MGSSVYPSLSTPTRVGEQTNWSTVTAGNSHTLAINTDGELWAWGNNSYGELGLGDTTRRYVPHRVGESTNWSTVTAGNSHTLAINTLGELWSWGRNDFDGQLGLGDTTNRKVPTRVGTANNWATVIAGSYHTLAINTDGELWSWGYNSSGQLGQSGKKNVPNRVGTASNWSTVTAGGEHTLAINTDGELWAWGRNSGGQLGLGDSGFGAHRSVPTRVGTASNWSTVTAGSDYTLAINTDGELWSWGLNARGQLGLGDTTARHEPARVGELTNWATVTAGFYNAFAINTDSELYSWGGNGNGSLGLKGGDRNMPTIIFGYDVVAPNSLPNGYTVSTPSATRVKIGGSYTFTITVETNYTAPIVKLNSVNGKINFSGIDGNVYTYTVSNVVGDIIASNFTVSVSRVA